MKKNNVPKSTSSSVPSFLPERHFLLVSASIDPYESELTSIARGCRTEPCSVGRDSGLSFGLEAR